MAGSAPTKSARSESAPSITAAWDAERSRFTRRLDEVRLAGVGAWFAMAWIFGQGMARPDWEAMAPPVSVYFACAIALWIGARLIGPLREISRFAPALMDVPLVTWTVWRVLEISPTPREASQFTIGIYVVLVVFALLTLTKRTIIAAAALGAAGEILLLRTAGISFDTQIAAVVILGVAAAGATVAASRLSQMAESLAAEQGVRDRLARHFSPETLATMRKAGPQAGAKARVTVVFADIPGFGALATGPDEAKMLAWLNEYLNSMVKVVFQNGGSVDRFYGDTLLAYFGAPVARREASKDALSCAVDMLHTVGELNARRAERGEPALAIGIGLHTGDAVVGEVGGTGEHVILGDVVSIAARIRRRTRDLGIPILVSETTYAELKTSFSWTAAGELTVPELSKPISIWAPTAATGRVRLGNAPAQTPLGPPGVARPRRPAR